MWVHHIIERFNSELIFFFFPFNSNSIYIQRLNIRLVLLFSHRMFTTELVFDSVSCCLFYFSLWLTFILLTCIHVTCYIFSSLSLAQLLTFSVFAFFFLTSLFFFLFSNLRLERVFVFFSSVNWSNTCKCVI